MFDHDEAAREMWEAIERQDDADWTCFCGNETVHGNPVPEHSVSEHNAVTYAADQTPVMKPADEMLDDYITELQERDAVAEGLRKIAKYYEGK